MGTVRGGLALRPALGGRDSHALEVVAGKVAAEGPVTVPVDGPACVKKVFVFFYEQKVRALLKNKGLKYWR